MAQIDIEKVEEQVSQKISQLQETIPYSETSLRKEFEQNMREFQRMHRRFLAMLNNPEASNIQWEKVESPTEEVVFPYEKIVHQWENRIQNDESYVRSLLNKLVVLKLNGGLGTTMGCTGPKSVIPIRGEDTFLDLTIKQIEVLNNKHGVNIPLVLMNSFNTHAETAKLLPKYTKDKNIRVLTFNQKQFPRINADTFLPIPKTADPEKTDLADWYPPGHGDVYSSFYNSGLYQQLISEGKEIMFMSNIDNLGAVVDLYVLAYLLNQKIDFCMEVTRKSLADVKGGTLIRYKASEQNVQVKLLEIAQVPPKHVPEFKSIDKFKIFNTNNLWVRLKAIEEKLDELKDNIEIINNRKEKDGVPVIQMETAAGAAVQVFKKAIGIDVPRSRFLPVKTCSDMLLIQSNVYELSPNGDYCLIVNPQRLQNTKLANTAPIIELSDEFKYVSDFNARFPKGIPDLLECESLVVSGDVTFGKNIKLKGNVKIIADKGKKFSVPDNTVLENTELRAP